MGIQGLLPFLKKSSRAIKLTEFRGKVAAVDVYCWLHKGAFSCAEKLVKGEPTDGYVFYVMKQVNLLLSHNIKPILVFDGCHLPAKEVTELKRRENRMKNRRKAKELLREGKIKEARECFQRCVDITSTMAHEVIKACRARNIDIIVAPYEADSQLAYLNLNGFADIVITEDSDLILFGCDKIIFKLDSNGGGVLVEKEKLHLSMNIPRDKFDFSKFRNMCILSGCDYLPSLHGIGLVKACRFFIVTSNPDVYTALCKLPTNLKMPHLEVTLEYRENFMKAINTLLHQLVFDPLSRTLKPLRPYPTGIDHVEMPYCGTFVGHDRAYQIALGNVDVQTAEIVDDFDPLNFKRPEMKSSGWGQKGDIVSNHPSIWDPNYQVLISDWQENKEKETVMRFKKCTVDVPFVKRKINVVIKEEDDVSEDMLENLYSSKKAKIMEPEPANDTANVENDVTNKSTYLGNSDDDTREMISPESENENLPIIEKCTEEVCGYVENDAENVSTIETSNIDSGEKLNDLKGVDSGSQSQHFNVVKDKSSGNSTPHRNPFAKKASPVPLDSENVSPSQLKSKFSALKKFSSQYTVVRSKYFRTDEDDDATPAENSTSDIELYTPQHSKMGNLNSIDGVDDFEKLDTCTSEKKHLKSPLKLKNEFVVKPDMKRNSKEIRSAFNWSPHSFHSKDKLINSSSLLSTKGSNKLSTSSPTNLFDTPPSSQNHLGENLKSLDTNPEYNNFEHLTPEDKGEEESERREKPTVLPRTPNSEKMIATRNCRVSGLKKQSPLIGKQKQLSLKDMFSFKKDKIRM